MTNPRRAPWRRADPDHLRALRAAAGAALFGGSLACGAVGASETLAQDERSPPDAGRSEPTGGGLADAGPALDLGEDVGRFLDASARRDAGPSSDLGPSEDAGLVDAGFCPPGPDWAECCEDAGWDPDRGCVAWGPPAPPPFSGIA